MNKNVFWVTLAVLFLAACASPSAPDKSSSTSSGPLGSVAVSLTLHDIYPGTFGVSGDDRNTGGHGAGAYMGVVVWIEDNIGNYVDTVEYFLSDQNNSYNSFYNGSWTHVPGGSGDKFNDSSKGMARKWTSLYSPAHVSGANGIDGVSGATIVVPNAGKAYSATWDGKDFNGKAAAAGTYKVRVLVMRHSNKLYGSTEYSYSIVLASGANSTGTADANFPLCQPGDIINPSPDNGVADVTVAFTHS